MSAPGAAASARTARRRRLHLHDGRRLAELQELLGGARREQMHASRDHPGPSGLVTRAEAGAIVTMEVLVEQDEIAPVRVILELWRSPVDRTSAVLVPHENARQASRDLLGDLIQVHPTPGAGRT